MARDGRNRSEEVGCLLDRHVQHLGDGLALEVHLERLTVVSRTMADLTGHIDVWQEVHLDLDRAVPGAVVTATALDVEREASGLVPADLRLGCLGEELAHMVEDAGVRRGVASRGPTDRPLVDVHYLVEVLQALDSLVPTGHLPCPIELVGKNHIEDVVDQCRLAGARNPRDRDEVVQREADIHVIEVVLARPDHGDHTAILGTPDRRDGDLATTRQIRAGDGVRVGEQVCDRA